MIKFKKHSGIYTLEAEQHLSISVDDAWAFFSSPKNLMKITPEHMNFRITSGEPAKAYEGQIITYKVSPVPFISVNWVTEITSVVDGVRFVDEQRFGPYTMWHHEHSFEKTDQGVLMKDKVSYKLPLGILGHLAHGLFVKGQLKGIFDYRTQVLKELFPSGA